MPRAIAMLLDGWGLLNFECCRMPLVIGADEAGYGPNLGPLVVAVSVWRVPERALRRDWYESLAGQVSREPESPGPSSSSRIAIADSKRLYNSSTGVRVLERGVLAAWGASQSGAALPATLGLDWRDLWRQFDPHSAEELDSTVWHAGQPQRTPTCGDVEAVARAQTALRNELARAQFELVELRARGVFPAEFNREVERRGNKAELLSHTTLDLVHAALARSPDDDAIVWCDKHSGRNHYGSLLQMRFPDPLVEVQAESRAVSRYRWRDRGRRVQIEFRAGGETALPVALASMTAKYLRELALFAFNAYWQAAVPGLRTTAGYPVDARRFKQDIAARQTELGIADDVMWRKR